MRANRAAGAVVLTFLLLTFLYALVVPPLEGFDALAHLKYAAYLNQERRLPRLEPETVDYSYELITQPPLYFAAIALVTLPLPMDQALRYVEKSDSPYHEKGLSLRQTITPPNMPAGVTATLWTARLVSILGGVVTVIGTYGLVRTLLPGEPWLAVATAALTGLNPQFLFTSVTITNDAWTPAVGVVTLWLLARATRQENVSWRDWALVGLCAGLAALTKYSSLLIALPGLLLFGRYVRHSGWRASLSALLWMAGTSALVAGWWFMRNWLLYGSPVPFAQMAIVLPTMQRPQPMLLPQVVKMIPWLFSSYWGVFVSIIAPPAYLTTTTWLMLIAAAGLLAGLLYTTFRPFTIHRSQFLIHNSFPLVFALVWFGVFFGGVLHWTRTIMFGEQGRLLHAAAPAFALLLITGWRAWLPVRWRPAFSALSPLAMVLIAFWPLPTLRDAYALPEPVAAPIEADRPIMATFAGGMRLIGVDLPAGAALAPGDRLPLTLYWQTDRAISEHYTLFLHLADMEDNLLFQFDGVPDGGRHPTTQWLPGLPFADRHRLTATTVTTDTLATLSLGFYQYDDSTARQPVFDHNGLPLGDRLILGQVRITAEPFAPPAINQPPLARWDDNIQLLSANIERDDAGAPSVVNLQWQATDELHTDYTVFVQVLDQDNQVVAQVDSQPQTGQAPTSTWRQGEIFGEQYRLEPSIVSWQRLIVGLYDATGQRLHLVKPTPGQDFLMLLERER